MINSTMVLISPTLFKTAVFSEISQRRVMWLKAPWTSRSGREFSNFWVWAAGGPLLADSQSGFRLYPLPEALHLNVQTRRYQFEVEILVKAQQQGLAVKEVPVRVIYQPKGIRVSHFQPWLDFRRNSATFNRLIWERIFRTLRRWNKSE